MRPSTLITVLALAACAAFTPGCHRDRARSPADRYALLTSSDPVERRDAADDMMDDGGPTPEDVQHLIAALQREQDPKAYGVMLLALGKSGSPEARPYIDANLQNPNKSVRERAEKALEEWSKKNPYGMPQPQAAPPGVPDAPPDPNGPPQLPPPPPGSPPPPAPPPGQDI